MTAIILYDSLVLAAKANGVLHHAFARAGQTTGLNILSWRTQLLRSEYFALQALKEAAEAHLVICAWLDSRPFQHWMENWLERWSAGRLIQDAAIAILRENDDGDCSGTAGKLSEFAQRHGLGVIASRHVITANPWRPLDSGRIRGRRRALR